jgi:hypothetical protein
MIDVIHEEATEDITCSASAEAASSRRRCFGPAAAGLLANRHPLSRRGPGLCRAPSTLSKSWRGDAPVVAGIWRQRRGIQRTA